MRKAILVLCCLVGAHPAFAQKVKDEPVRVYVFARPVAAPTGFVDEAREVRGLEDSVKDLKKELGARQKRDLYALVDSAEQAQVTIEVTFSGEAPVTETETTKSRWDGKETSKDVVKQLPKLAVVMRVQGAEYFKEFTAHEQSFWGTLAYDIVKQLDKWIKVNRAQLRKPL